MNSPDRVRKKSVISRDSFLETLVNDCSEGVERRSVSQHGGGGGERGGGSRTSLLSEAFGAQEDQEEEDDEEELLYR